MPVVIKESIHPDVNLKSEYKMLALVGKHPNIIDFFGCVHSTDFTRLAIMMEFCPFGSLENLLHCNTHLNYSTKHALIWIMNICSALIHLHSIDIVHRDLKPANVLLFKSGKMAKISDFGTTKRLALRMTSTTGSIPWMAPEVYKGQNYDEKCDIYSVGVIFWECLTRKVPYSWLNCNLIAIISSVAENGLRPPKIKNNSPALNTIIKSCLDNNPEYRKNSNLLRDTVKIEYEKLNTFLWPIVNMPLSDQSDLKFLNLLSQNVDGLDGWTVKLRSLLVFVF
ncbi:MAG: Mitogen-activated protein kinase kinase kinase 7 [Paramarteilia canceri]